VEVEVFQQEIENIYAAGGYCFVEFGPKNVLTNLVKEILSDKPHIAIAVNANHTQDSDKIFRQAVIQLRVAGLSLQNIDPYQVPTKTIEIPEQKVLSVRLNSTNITEKTQKTFAKALEDGSHISVVSPQPTVNENPVTLVNEKLEEAEIQPQDHERVIHSLESFIT
ncbi:MAG: hypothetical protein ACKO86_12250, partial [Dolichospermum sp.]